MDKNKLQEFSSTLRDWGMVKAAKRIENAIIRLDDSQFNILVVGEFSRGKSTFMNLLMKNNIFQVSAVPVNTINEIHWNDTSQITVIKNGKRETVSYSDFIDIANEADYDLVEVGDTNQIFKDVRIVEYPTLTPAREGRLSESQFSTYVVNSDLVIVVLACDMLLSSSESDAIKQYIHPEGHTELVFLCNFLDRIREGERDTIRDHGYSRLPAPRERISFLSLRDAADGVANGDDALIASSGYLDFEKQLIGLLETRRDEIKLGRIREVSRIVLDDIRARLELSRTDIDTQVATRIKEREKLEQRVDVLSDARFTLLKNVQDQRARMKQLLKEKLETFIYSTSLRIEKTLKDMSSTDTPDAIEKEVKTAFKQWQEDDLRPYLVSKVSEESGLQQELNLFVQQAKGIANDLGLSSDEWTIPVIEIEVDSLNDEEVRASLPNDVQHSKGSTQTIEFENISEWVIGMGVTGAGLVLVGLFWWNPVVLVPSGVGLLIGAGLLREKGKNQENMPNLSVISDRWRVQAKPLSDEIVRKIDDQMERLEREIERQTDAVVNTLQQEIASSSEHNDMEEQLETIRYRLSTLAAIDGELKD